MRSSNTCLNPVRELIRLLSAVSLLCCLTAISFALDPNRAAEQYLRDHLGPEKGFPASRIYAITQTADGYLWVGSESGLFRFDGVLFKQIRDTGPNAFALDRVLGLVADPDGSLWVQLPEPTLLRYRDGVFTRLTSITQKEDPRVTAVTRGKAARLFFASRRAGVQFWTGTDFRRVQTTTSLPIDPVISIAEIAEREIWLGTRDAGLIRIDAGATSTITKGLPDSKINCLLAGEGGEFLAGTDLGMVRWNGRELTKTGLPKLLTHVPVLSLARDRDSNIWIGTGSHGLLRLNEGRLSPLDERGAGGAITALFEDREGDLWLGKNNGIERVRESVFVTPSLTENPNATNRGPVYADSEGKVWWAPASGGVFWRNESGSGSLKVGDLERDVVYSVSGAKSDLWLGRQRGGLTHLHFNGNSIAVRTYTRKDGLAQNSVYTVHENRDGSVWAGTVNSGLSHFQEGRFRSFGKADGLASNTVTCIAEAANGTMWFGTPLGLSSYGPNGWKNYGTQDGLPSANVYSLLVDSAGVPWVGTLQGIAFINSGHVVIPRGLPDSLREQILGMAEDRFGSLWIVTLRNVLRVTRDKLWRGRINVDEDVHEYGPADGLSDMRGVRRDRTMTTDALGRIWIARSGGLSMVDPARLKCASVPPIVHIEGFSVDGDAVSHASGVLVPPGSKRIALEYTGLNLAAPERIRFRYKLDGFDQNWSRPVAGKEAVYTNLAPGSYRFRVMANNGDGVWNGEEAAIPFEVDPAIWQTLWFRVCALLALVFAVVLIYRLRIRRMTAQVNLRFDERLAERTRLARELHDTLLQTIQASKMVAEDGLDEELGASDSTRVRTALEKVSLWLGKAAVEGRAALNSLRTSTSTENDLTDAFQHALRDCVKPGSMQVDLSVEGEPVEMHPVVRDEVFRIGYEAIRNACRHSGGNHLEVELCYAKHLTLRVRDNGKGISPETAARGKEGHFGLLGMQERAVRVGGKLNLFSSPESGTEIELTVPGNIVFRGKRKRIFARLGRPRRDETNLSKSG